MHEANADPSVVQGAISWYKEMEEAQAAEAIEQDKAYRKESEDALRDEWGSEFRSNVNAIENFLATAPEGVGDNLLGARLGDGTLLSANPDALRWLAKLADDVNPAGFLAPTPGMNDMQSIESRLKEISEIRRTEPNKYFGDEPMQEEYRKLLEAQEKLQARAG
jgi:hypothetical protein